MQTGEYQTHVSGRLLHTPQDYWAYIPAPLEPTIRLDTELLRHLSSADRALSELAGIARTLPNPRLLIGPFIRREAVLSSRIEGTQASFSDLLFFEAARLREREVPDVLEVGNYVRALEYGLDRLKDLPVSLRLLREMHRILLNGVRGDTQTPGEFRRSQNWIGPPGCTLMEAAYVPPPVVEMGDALDRLEKYLHAQSEYPPLIRLAMIHYQFEAIHPFLDGNGRIGRLLMALLLCAEGLLSQPVLYLSAFFEKHREEYYRRLLAVSQRGSWEDWIKFFLQAFAVQATDGTSRSGQLLRLWQAYRDKMQQARASGLLLRLIDRLFALPAATIPDTARGLAVTQRSAQLMFGKLVSAGMLQEATGQRRNRVFIAPEIIRIVEE